MMTAARRRRALFLYAEPSAYFMACVRTLVREHDWDALVVHWPLHPNAPFRFVEEDHITLLPRDASAGAMGDAVRAFAPDVVYVSGWMDRAYLELARGFRAAGIPVIGGTDAVWRASPRQRVLTTLGRRFLRRRFSHLWIPGAPQYDYARRLGFPADRILTGLYSADVELFRAAGERRRARPAPESPTLVFVGRLIEHKQPRALYDAFHAEAASANVPWRLRIIGNGPLAHTLPPTDICECTPFLQPEELAAAAGEASAFVLPSLHEPWGVVLHEFAAAGVPLLASSACGAASAFVQHLHNGFVFEAGNDAALRGALRWLFRLTPDELDCFGRRSLELASQCTPQSWAAGIHGVVVRDAA